MVNFGELQIRVHGHARNAGFYDGVDVTVESVSMKLALIHSEISEALEELRSRGVDGVDVTEIEDNGKPAGFQTELADAIIRILDLAEWLGLDLGDAVEMKHQYNLTRSYRHDGKKF